jgi:hypothetical protein
MLLLIIFFSVVVTTVDTCHKARDRGPMDTGRGTSMEQLPVIYHGNNEECDVTSILIGSLGVCVLDFSLLFRFKLLQNNIIDLCERRAFLYMKKEISIPSVRGKFILIIKSFYHLHLLSIKIETIKASYN